MYNKVGGSAFTFLPEATPVKDDEGNKLNPADALEKQRAGMKAADKAEKAEAEKPVEEKEEEKPVPKVKVDKTEKPVKVEKEKEEVKK